MDLMGKMSQLVENMRENIIVKKGKGFWITSKLVINEKQKREVKEEKTVEQIGNKKRNQKRNNTTPCGNVKGLIFFS